MLLDELVAGHTDAAFDLLRIAAFANGGTGVLGRCGVVCLFLFRIGAVDERTGSVRRLRRVARFLAAGEHLPCSGRQVGVHGLHERVHVLLEGVLLGQGCLCLGVVRVHQCAVLVGGVVVVGLQALELGLAGSRCLDEFAQVLLEVDTTLALLLRTLAGRCLHLLRRLFGLGLLLFACDGKEDAVHHLLDAHRRGSGLALPTGCSGCTGLGLTTWRCACLFEFTLASDRLCFRGEGTGHNLVRGGVAHDVGGVGCTLRFNHQRTSLEFATLALALLQRSVRFPQHLECLLCLCLLLHLLDTDSACLFQRDVLLHHADAVKDGHQSTLGGRSTDLLLGVDGGLLHTALDLAGVLGLGEFHTAACELRQFPSDCRVLGRLEEQTSACVARQTGFQFRHAGHDLCERHGRCGRCRVFVALAEQACEQAVDLALALVVLAARRRKGLVELTDHARYTDRRRNHIDSKVTDLCETLHDVSEDPLLWMLCFVLGQLLLELRLLPTSERVLCLRFRSLEGDGCGELSLCELSTLLLPSFAEG